jgi:DNA replication and repair protein RecF
LPLRRIRITALRCLREVDLEVGPRSTFVYGPNGAGKTSFLEGVFVLGRGRSFRTRQIRRLVMRGAEGFAVFGTVEAEEARLRRLGVAYSAGRFEKKIDGEPAGSMAELAGILPVHALDPSMHALVEGGPSERRRFLDWGVFHVEHGYLEAWKHYRRALSQRNAALKAGARPSELRPWSMALAEAGAAVEQSRRRYVAQLRPRFAAFGEQLLGRALDVDYRPGWDAGQPLLETLLANDVRDRAAGTTEQGPHRAELVVRLDERRIQDEASRGQQKLAAAALILAQVGVEAAVRPRTSVLVVDDPAAELDRRSLGRLLEAIATLPVQVLFTALSPADLPAADGSPVFHVEQGEIRAV